MQPGIKTAPLNIIAFNWESWGGKQLPWKILHFNLFYNLKWIRLLLQCLKITKGHIIPQHESLYKSTRAGNWSGIGGGEWKLWFRWFIKPSFIFERKDHSHSPPSWIQLDKRNRIIEAHSDWFGQLGYYFGFIGIPSLNRIHTNIGLYYSNCNRKMKHKHNLCLIMQMCQHKWWIKDYENHPDLDTSPFDWLWTSTVQEARMAR